MTDQMSVGRIGGVTNPQQEINLQALQMQQNAAVTAATIKNVEQPDKKAETKEQTEEGRKQEQKAYRQLSAVEMQFEINRETNEITLKIMDKETKEIIRTIPERAWSDLSVAELFKITA